MEKHHSRRLFWATCPQCKHVIGIEPRVVAQYLARVIADYRRRFRALDDLLDAQAARIRRKRAH